MNIKQLFIYRQELINESLEQPLLQLSKKSAQLNHTLNYKLDSSISLSLDIPSLQNSWKLLNQYKPHNILSSKIQLKSSQDCISNLQTILFGILLIYTICEKKIILYSNCKSKLSQSILHILQIIKPLEYVSPIIITTLKQQHQEYFSAPMSLLLGLWVEQKKVQRQKIQIFMNKKENVAGMIEKAKMDVIDGLIINLDTGLVYGTAINQQLNRIALKLNLYYQTYSNYSKQIYKLFEKIFSNSNDNHEEPLIYELQKSLKQVLEGTQLYMYYQEKHSN